MPMEIMCTPAAGVTTAQNWAVHALVIPSSLWALLSSRKSRSPPALPRVWMTLRWSTTSTAAAVTRPTSCWTCLLCTDVTEPAAPTRKPDNGKLTFTEFQLMDQPLEDRARTKTLKYTQNYANNTSSHLLLRRRLVASTQSSFGPSSFTHIVSMSRTSWA